MSDPNPRNIVHLSSDDINAGRTEHVTFAEALALSGFSVKIGDLSFANSVILSAATTTGSFLSFELSGVSYAFPLYTP
jgi:hypothetical protein